LTRSISIIIPAYNEEKRLPATLDRILAYLDAGKWTFSEIIVVNDGSADGTAAVATRFAQSHSNANVKVLENPGNRGKGYSVRHGMLEAQGEWALFSDADLSAPIEELEKLWEVAGKSDATVIIGSRALDRGLIGVHQSTFREYGGRVFNLILRLVTGLPFWDTQCGFKLFAGKAAREIFRRQRAEGFGFDAEILFIARHLGNQIREVPVRWNHVEGTKMRLFSDTLRMMLDLPTIRWNQLCGRYR
jgi:dolichyl-phosphate beta-glucosyltransferase